MATGSLAPTPKQQFFDDNGEPLNDGQLFVFKAGTSTQSLLYHDAALSSPMTNPYGLIDAGQTGPGSYLTPGGYMAPSEAQKWMLQFGPTPVLVDDPVMQSNILWTVDPVQSINLIAPSTDVFEFFDFDGSSTTGFTNTTVPAGSTLDKVHAGSAVLIIDPDDIPAGSYFLRGIVKSATVTVEIGLYDLSSATPNTALALATGTSTTGVLVQSTAITFPAGGTKHVFGVKVRVTTAGTGNAWALKLSRSLPV